jgi:hypothetical protein
LIPEGAKRIVYQEVDLGEILLPVLRGGDYQREPNPRKVRSIVQNYNPLRFGTPELGFYDGHFWVWEGGNRFIAAKELGMQTMWCRVGYGFTKEDYAQAFADQGKDRTAVGPKDTIRAKLVAGDTDYTKMVAILEAEGYHLDLHRKVQKATNTWASQGAVKGIVQATDGNAILEIVARVLRDSWGDCEPSNTFLSGLGEFVQAYRNIAPSPVGERGYFAQTLTAVLKNYDHAHLLHRARNLDRAGTQSSKVRWVLVDYYNFGRKYRLPELDSLR